MFNNRGSKFFFFFFFFSLEIGALLATFGQQMVFCIEDLQHRRTVLRGGGGAGWRDFLVWSVFDGGRNGLWVVLTACLMAVLLVFLEPVAVICAGIVEGS
jgi:hypothetical protein